MDLNLEEYELLKIDKVSTIVTEKNEKLYDITVDSDDHTFFINLPKSNIDILTHNCDGSHITSMIIGWFKRFAPNLFNEGKICKLITPLIIVKNKKQEIVKYFFNINEFKKWENTNTNTKLHITYNKGLGSFEKEDLIELINKVGLDNFIIEYQLDDEGNIYIEDWLGVDSEKRKQHLRNYMFDINKA